MKFNAVVQGIQPEARCGFRRDPVERILLEADGFTLTITGTPDRFKLGETWTVTISKEAEMQKKPKRPRRPGC